jgi:glycosyltransferase involved in cell wall biosynthesis
VNLSVHNDEDYGMSVAEALCSGIPAILTDWGGLASFRLEQMPEASTYIPVQIGERNKLIDYASVVAALQASLEAGHFQEREKLSRLAIERFGIQAVEEIVRTVLTTTPEPFTKFTAFFEYIAGRVRLKQGLYLTTKQTISKLYREIYSSYVRNH